MERESTEFTLSQQQVRFFRDAGYLKLPWSIASEKTERAASILQEHIVKRIAPFRTNKSGKIIRLDAIIQRSFVFREIAVCDEIIGPLIAILGPNIVLTTNRHNHATTNLRGNHPIRLHRDILQWSRSVVTVIVYLDETAIQTGCTHLIPTSHFLPFVGTPNNGGTWMDEHSVYHELIDQALAVPMSVGGILIFDSLVFHTAGFNYADEPRRSLCFAYHSIDELAKAKDETKILVHGSDIYRGNDEP